ncbi:hypothetical protein TSMEX_004337 [Taenia solium]|eukprot:TsM_000072300 transcript=TsM_000072300 gene=TsM_000072300
MNCRRWKEARDYWYALEANTVAHPQVSDEANVVCDTPLHQPSVSAITMSSVLPFQSSNPQATEEVLGSDLTDLSYHLYWICTSVLVMNGSREVEVKKEEEEEEEKATCVHFTDIFMQAS